MTADHNILNLESESRHDHRNAFAEMDIRIRYRVSPQNITIRQKQLHICRGSRLHPRRPGTVYTDTSEESFKECQDVQWPHDTRTAHRSETNDFAERFVRLAKEGTATAIVKVFFCCGGTALWNIIATDGTCTTKWSTARQLLREDVGSSSEIHVKNFKHQEVTREETLSFPGGDGTLKNIRSPSPSPWRNIRRGEPHARRRGNGGRNKLRRT